MSRHSLVSFVVILNYFVGPGTSLSDQIGTPTPAILAYVEQLSRFEVATIKPTKQDNYKPIGLYVYPGGRVRAGQSTLKMLVQFAFNLKAYQVFGGPRWADEDLYEVEALPPDSSPSRLSKPQFVNMPPSDEQRKMLQSLLIERFGLKFHRGVRDESAYILARSNKPLKLESAKHKEFIPILSIGQNGADGLSGQSVSMPFLCMRLSTYLERPVLDQTELKGLFDFKLAPHSGDSSQESNEDFVGRIYQSIEQLGLKLKPGRAPMETLYIERATRPMGN